MKFTARALLNVIFVIMLPAAAGATWANQKAAYAAALRRSWSEPGYLLEVALSHPFLLFLLASIGVLFVMSGVFCVLAIVYRRRNNRMAERWMRMEAEWEPYVVSVLNGEQLPIPVEEYVRKDDRLYFVDFLTRFAMRFQGEELLKIAALARPFLEDIAEHLRSKAAAQRARAVQTLGLLGFARYSAEIVNALEDESPLVAMLAARALAHKDHPEFVAPVILRLYRFSQWSPKFLASMLSAVGPKAAPLLRAAYADQSNDSQVRAVAAETLRLLNDLPSGEIAATVLDQEKESENLAESVRRRPGADETRAAAMGEARSEWPDPAAVSSWSSLASSSADRAPLEGEPHPHRDLIATSLRLVRNLGRQEHAVKARLFCDSADFVIRECAYRALGRIGNGEDIARLQRALEDSSVWVALHAARALRELGADKKLRELASIVHPHSDVARQVLAESIQ